MSRFKLIRADEVLKFSNDWGDGVDATKWLAVGDSISSRVWTVSPSATLANATTDTVTISGCIRLSVHRLKENVVTAGGETGSRTYALLCW